jgi:hypothetical protein
MLIGMRRIKDSRASGEVCEGDTGRVSLIATQALGRVLLFFILLQI